MARTSPQSALDPAGEGAARIAELFAFMAIGGALIWLLVIGVAIYALWRPVAHSRRATMIIVIGGGALFPTVVLSVLLCYGLSMLPDLQRRAPESSQVVEVTGVRWWWRVTYQVDSDRAIDGNEIELANEIRLPLNEAIEFKLSSEDVIHSFWIPSLGGKMDMIPGRVNRLKLVPTRPGNYRGVCAEFCGAAHAQMAFDVVVLPRDEFDTWLQRQSQPADAPDEELAKLGQEVFLYSGCSACHTIRGSEADGVVGPQLTHFGSRLSIGAGLLENTSENLRNWIRTTHRVKPGVEMPSFATLSEDELDALVGYLEQLR